MTATYALQILTGFLSLFGLNVPTGHKTFPALNKTRVQRPEEWPVLNGKLFSGGEESPDIKEEGTPSPAPQEHDLGVEKVGAGKEARQQANAAARAELLKAEADADILRGYSGGGGLGESIDAYYTPKEVASLMWKMLAPSLGFSEKSKKPRPHVIDPTCGTGALLQGAPEGILVSGVEFDSDAARIAKALLPHAAIYEMPFECFTTSSSVPLFDAAIMNPPFGNRGKTRDLHEPEEMRSERYILRQTIRRVKHGGLIAALLPLNLFYGQNHTELRRELLRLALPLHLITVPSGAFKDTGATVTTVIALLRRHDLGVEEAVSTLSDQALIDLMVDYGGDYTQKHVIRQWISGESLLKSSKTKEGEQKYAPAVFASSYSLAQGVSFEVGHYGQAIIKGKPYFGHLNQILDDSQKAVKSAPVTLKSVLETVRLRWPEQEEEARARSAAAPLHAIKEGTVKHRFIFQRGEWFPLDAFTEAVIQDAAKVAQELHFFLDAVHQRRPEAQKLRKKVVALDRAYRSKHGRYPVSKLAKLTQHFELFGLLLSALGEGELKLPDISESRLPISAQTPLDIAYELADLLALTKENLMDYAGLEEKVECSPKTGQI